jgi:hypothetical protein
LAVASVMAGAGGPKSALEEFTDLQKMAGAADRSGDHPAHLRYVLEMVKLLNGAADAVEASAEAYAENGDRERALAALSRFAELGQVDAEVLEGKSKRFESLEKSPQFHDILDRFRANEQAVSLAEKVFSLSDRGLLAEDIDFDPVSKSFLITSVLENKIIRVSQQGTATEFAQSPRHWPMLAVKVDAARRLVWATEEAINGFTAVAKTDWGRSAVLCFDLDTAKLKDRIEGKTQMGLGDMVLTASGTPIASDGDGGGLYEVRNGTLERIDAGDFISPQTAVLDPDGIHLFVPDYVRGIGRLDLQTRTVTWLETGSRFAVNGIDGLYFRGKSLIATQNGTFPERVIRFQLSPTRTAIQSEQIMERSTPSLGDPTHGVLVGGFFYYIANSGWDKLDEHGALKAGAAMTPALIMRFPLGDSRPTH